MLDYIPSYIPFNQMNSDTTLNGLDPLCIDYDESHSDDQTSTEKEQLKPADFKAVVDAINANSLDVTKCPFHHQPLLYHKQMDMILCPQCIKRPGIRVQTKGDLIAGGERLSEEQRERIMAHCSEPLTGIISRINATYDNYDKVQKKHAKVYNKVLALEHNTLEDSKIHQNTISLLEKAIEDCPTPKAKELIQRALDKFRPISSMFNVPSYVNNKLMELEQQMELRVLEFKRYLAEYIIINSLRIYSQEPESKELVSFFLGCFVGLKGRS